MKRALVALVAGAVLVGATAPIAIARTDTGYSPYDAKGSGRATPRDYLELLRMLGRLKTTVTQLQALTTGTDTGWNPECRGYSPEKTVRCIAVKQDPPGGVDQAVAVWQCESGFGTEGPHTDAYHGPFQYLASTYMSQQEAMPDLVRMYGLSGLVHDMRSNIITAVGWAARHGWGAWSCA